MHPKVSIILPIWKEAKYIKRAIDSIMSQTFLDWECIIINDGLYNGVENIIKEYIENDKRIIILKNENNLGIQKTLNKGLTEAKGEYIARIDDDDIWVDKDKLKKQIDFLDKNLDYALVGTRVIYANEEGEEVNRSSSVESYDEIRQVILRYCCFVHSSVVFRKDVILKLGGYSEEEDTKHSEDYDLWLRVCSENKAYRLSTYSVVYTVRNENICSKNKLSQIKNDIRFIQKYKSKYPNYYKALIFNYTRFILYRFFLKKSLHICIYNIKSRLGFK